MRARKATRTLTGALAFWLSCGLLASFAQMTKPAPPTPIDAKKAELGGKTWNPEWDHMLEQGIPEAMLSSQVPHDVRRFCLRFYSMSDTDKRVFWAYFFQALAGAEAGLNPDTRVRHRQPEVNKIDEVTHRPVRQEGLLQLTYQDKKAYGCDFDWERDRELKSDDPDKTILRPRNNLECGITILYNQIITHHKKIVTKSSYWSTLHPGTLDYRVFLHQMTNPPAACALPTPPSRLKQETTATVHAQAQESASAR